MLDVTQKDLSNAVEVAFVRLVLDEQTSPGAQERPSEHRFSARLRKLSASVEKRPKLQGPLRPWFLGLRLSKVASVQNFNEEGCYGLMLLLEGGEKFPLYAFSEGGEVPVTFSVSNREALIGGIENVSEAVTGDFEEYKPGSKTITLHMASGENVTLRWKRLEQPSY